jgi:hypothetical protein
MKVLLTGRGEGKTTALMDWVKGGVRVEPYPGWSRVGIVITERLYLDMKRQYWGEVEDFDHRIYQIDEFQRGKFPTNRKTAYRIDNLEMLIYGEFHIPGMGGTFRIPNLDGFTMTGEKWEEES